MANIRDSLASASLETDVDKSNMFEFTYTQQSITLSDGTVVGGGGEVKIVYIKKPGEDPGYFSAASTRYTQVEQPFIPKVGADDVTGDVINSKAYGGGFKIEERPIIGSDNSTTP